MEQSVNATNATTVATWTDAKPWPFWLDPDIPGHDVPEPTRALSGAVSADLAVVGGGLSGLWTALVAKERDPDRDVVLLEAHSAGWAASGRNGGFCAASLTHGFANGAARWPNEIAELERLGRANLDEIEAAVKRHGIDCEFERTGEFAVATDHWQAAGFATEADAIRRLGYHVDLFDADGIRAEVNSPTYVGAMIVRDSVAMLHPAKLVWGLRSACLRLGVRVFENAAVQAIRREAEGLRLDTVDGSVRASRVAWAVGAFPGPLKRLRHYIAPVYDYALMSEPLDDQQLASVGWRGRQGIADSGNQFHYYRLSADNRILWGGYDVIHHYGGRIRPEFDQRAATFQTLAEHFFATFPQLEGLGFTHRWGGLIDTCSRFSPFFGTAFGGRLAYAGGYTGLGVGAARFGAEVMLDKLSGEETVRTRLEMVRSKPMPFPPEPIRSVGIALTLRATAAADRNGGKRNLWLRTLARLGLGFDS
jgi:glycine/D-amino acid oxidase-like deaminating enzyme